MSRDWRQMVRVLGRVDAVCPACFDKARPGHERAVSAACTVCAGTGRLHHTAQARAAAMLNGERIAAERWLAAGLDLPPGVTVTASAAKPAKRWKHGKGRKATP